jgi:hypothetical protein
MGYNIKYLVSSGFDLWSQPCVESGTVSSGIGGGYIEVEPGFQMISVPVIYGYWSSITHEHVHDGVTVATVGNYIVDQIEDIYGANAATMVEVFNTIIGGHGSYFNFVPGVTDYASTHNFQLGYFDFGANSYEYIGFFIKSIHPIVFTIKWGDI